MSDGDDSPGTAAEVQLRRSADALGDRLSIDLTPGARRLLNARIAAGAQRLVSEGTAEDPDSMDRARASLADVLFQARHGAVPEGERSATLDELRPPAHAIEEAELRAVFSALCPGLWPFC